jgi:hypothetical protein
LQKGKPQPVFRAYGTVIFCTLQPTYGTYPRYSQAYSLPMNLHVASDPVAVLVLAWDEATPATRVLVEATAVLEPALDSVVALVPTGLAADELSQEEFLPLEASITPPEPPAASEPLGDAPAKIASTAAPHPLSPLPNEASHASEQAETTATAAEATAPLLPAPASVAATAAALVEPALVWQEVRVLRFGTKLGSAKLAAPGSYLGQGEPTFVWTGNATAPAAPYLGSSDSALLADDSLAVDTLAGDSAAAALLGAAETPATALIALRTLGSTSGEATLPTGEVPVSAQPPAYLVDELPEAPDAESDATPAPLADEPALITEASTTELSEEAAAPEEPFTVDVSPVQAAEPAAIAPPVPAGPAPPVAEPEFFALAETEASPELAALRPAGRPFDAPNLNFQIIQYARLAVPQALNEQPFEVIYAPAWPTWLAAQELRHRSGQPLVLHIAKLAAADGESIDLAAGWIAELQRQGLHRADLILTETQALAQRLRHELGLPASRVRPVPAADAAAVAQALRTAVRV